MACACFECMRLATRNRDMLKKYCICRTVPRCGFRSHKNPLSGWKKYSGHSFKVEQRTDGRARRGSLAIARRVRQILAGLGPLRNLVRPPRLYATSKSVLRIATTLAISTCHQEIHHARLVLFVEFRLAIPGAFTDFTILEEVRGFGHGDPGVRDGDTGQAASGFADEDEGFGHG